MGEEEEAMTDLLELRCVVRTSCGVRGRRTVAKKRGMTASEGCSVLSSAYDEHGFVFSSA